MIYVYMCPCKCALTYYSILLPGILHTRKLCGGIHGYKFNFIIQIYTINPLIQYSVNLFLISNQQDYTITRTTLSVVRL